MSNIISLGTVASYRLGRIISSLDPADRARMHALRELRDEHLEALREYSVAAQRVIDDAAAHPDCIERQHLAADVVQSAGEAREKLHALDQRFAKLLAEMVALVDAGDETYH